jgi:two-component system nitrogen regulation response regulator NtrX
MENLSDHVVLIVDDERSICETLAGVLSDEGWVPVTASSGREGLAKLVEANPDIVLLDVWMPGMDGIETLQKMRQIRQNIPIVIMSGHGSIETAVKATKLGAFDYLEKPLSLEKILPIMAHAKDLKVVRSQMSLATAGTPYEILGQSQEIELIRNQIGMVAPRNAWVLITGENGTGKEVVARNIHAQSSRANGPFVAVNCAAIPEELIESELFGHAKGAFTNAIAAKKGRFEVAHQGTLFLDEIADMSLKTQAKILRILQEQKFERVGETTPLTVDVRVVAATNKDLVGEIAAGRFREDLFYRLNVVPFRVPALRERRIDIPVLANFFLTQTATNLKEPRKSLSPAAMEVLQSYPWPGNVRELKNLVERLCIMIPRAEIMDSDLPEAIQRRDGSQETSAYSIAAGSLREAKADFERAFILEKLEEFGWNVSKTAEAIGIERSNLHRKLRTYNIDPKKLKG